MVDPGLNIPMPEWAAGMVDLHVHAWPSLLPRHGSDAETVQSERELGFDILVLKAHEGSTVERAAVVGEMVYGGVVLNSAIGGANPDAVEIAARLGGRVVWLPTVSAATHKIGATNPELQVHRGFEMRQVDVISEGHVRPEWFDVLDVVARHDLVLASGHLSCDETVIVFTEARRRGITRLLVNHPKMGFLGWNDDAKESLLGLGAFLELGILPDLLGTPEQASMELIRQYPGELLAFGGDLGHADHATPSTAIPPWVRQLEQRAGPELASAIMTTHGRQLLLP